MRHVIVRIADMTELDDTREQTQVTEVIQQGFNSRAEAEQAIEDLVHQGDTPNTLLPWYSPNLGYDPYPGMPLVYDSVTGSWRGSKP